MIEAGQVNEVREFFNQKDFDYDYTRGIRRAIGVPEFDEFFRAESQGVTDGRTMKKLLEVATDALKVNNCKLVSKQVEKIHRLYGIWKKNMHRLDATEVVLKEDNWEDRVLAKSLRIVHKFLYEDGGNGGCIEPAKIPIVAGFSHVLICPKREVKRFLDLTVEETSDLWLTAQKVGRQLESYHKASSLTLAIQDGPQAGQTVPHVHIHVVPRKGGDFEKNDKIYDAMDEKEKELKEKLDLDKERKDRSAKEMSQEAEEYRKLFL
ncbi:unnamed protein product [Vicia faba]|uniref:Bis(5'-adenosyl)-triphosphatase n=1 Tax=Vicia faba TaxID=3906 RepID=A0AAV0Z3K8_VICFA|nr:unnamed protein product [Vicia faba]